jgi:hypothetical protein
MPVDFLSDSEAAKYGRYDGPPSQAEMEKIFFLHNEDMALIKGHRGRHIQCGFALQLVTFRYLGCFLADPLEVLNEVLDVVAQPGIDDPPCVRCRRRGLMGRSVSSTIRSTPSPRRGCRKCLGEGGHARREAEGVMEHACRTSRTPRRMGIQWGELGAVRR